MFYNFVKLREGSCSPGRALAVTVSSAAGGTMELNHRTACRSREAARDVYNDIVQLPKERAHVLPGPSIRGVIWAVRVGYLKGRCTAGFS
eukprot:7328085-Pyramimonas_sp.AAC.2